MANEDEPSSRVLRDAGARSAGHPGSGTDRRADVRTFLIADVRGYTNYTREHGDEAAAHLASTFAELVREVVEARQGSLLELRGDEALVVFISGRQALRAAVELQDRFTGASLPRGVGIGLDSGEAVPVGEGYRGGALNLAARLCSRASPGQVLASEAVIHLAGKVEGLAYVDPRTFRLKGYAEPIRAVEVVPAERARRYTFPRKITRRTGALLSRRAARVGVAGLVVIALVAVFLPRLLTGRGGSVLENDPPGMAILDAKSGHQQAFVGTSVVKSPLDAKYADGHFWVLNESPASFAEIDPRTGAVRQITSPFPNVSGYTVNGNDLWVTDGDRPNLAQVDIRLGREVNRFSLSDDPNVGYGGGLFAGGSLWVESNPELDRIDPATGIVQHRFVIDFGPGGTAYDPDDGSIWVGGNVDGNGLSRVDPNTNTVAATAKVAGDLCSLTAGGGFAWTSDGTKGVVYKVDPQGNVVGTYPTGEGACAASYADGVLWVANQDVGTVSGIDAVTGQQTTYRFRHPLGAVAAGSGAILVRLNKGRTYEDRINALRGKVAKFLVAPHQLDDVDPATAFSTLGYEIEFATCATLLRYPDKPSPVGWKLQPEVAASIPDVSADGRTYRFTVRPGYRFSPPSGEPLTAETFRHSIERALSPKLAPGWLGPRTTVAAAYLSTIRGEQAFVDGKAPRITGLRAEGNELTVELVRPSPDFLHQLAMPFFCPVPTTTPVVPGGAVTEVPGGIGAVTVPSAGPYYVAESFGGEYTILKRNPNYRGPRPHRLDAIALREGIDPGKAVVRVRSGTWDGITNLVDPVLGPHGPMARKWGAGGTSAAKQGQRYYPVPDGGLEYLVFNASRSLFSDRRVREAVAYALDRTALARIGAFGSTQGDSLPTDRLLPPNQPGSEGNVFPLDGPDLQKAKALMHGRRATAVFVTNPFGVNPVVAQEIRNELALIGIDVRIKRVQNSLEAIQEPGAPYDLKMVGSSLDPIDPIAYVQGLLTALQPGSPLTSVLPQEWKSPAVGRMTIRLAEARTEAEAFALFHAIVREIPTTGIAYSVAGAFFSPRIGCRVFPPASFGVDFAALCLAG